MHGTSETLAFQFMWVFSLIFVSFLYYTLDSLSVDGKVQYQCPIWPLFKAYRYLILFGHHYMILKSLTFWTLIKLRTGPDLINHKMLIYVSTAVSKPLTINSNRSLQEKHYPEPWKKNNVVPLFKDLYSCIFNIIRLGTKHKKTYWMTHTQFTGKGSDKGLSVYR